VDAPGGFANVLDRCLAVRPAEQVLLLTDGGTYVIRHFAQLGDGATVRVVCARD
jgi:hypothetical protein